jgi:hypothetical protein
MPAAKFETSTGWYDIGVSRDLARDGATPMLETVLKRFEEPDEYQPGWRWSVDVGPSVGALRCNVEHVGMVLSGCATAAMEDGTIHELRAGTLFYIPPGPPGHDSWVVGDAPYVSLHFLGADDYTNK